MKPASAAASVRNALGELGKVEPVGEQDLLLVRLDESSRDVEAARRRLLDETKDVAWAEPALLDERNEPQLPTGEISVRFTRSLSDDELEAFAAEHGLRLRARNEFVPEQATFTRADPRLTTLQGLLPSLSAAPDVRSAFANTLSRYRRS